MKNVKKWFVVTIAAVGLVLLIAGRNFIVAQTTEPETPLPLKYKIFIGTIESCEKITCQTETMGSEVTESYGVWEFSVVYAAGLDPENIMSMSILTPASSPFPAGSSVIGNEILLADEGLIYIMSKMTSYMRMRYPTYDADGNFTGYGEWSAWSATEMLIRSGSYKVNVIYVENLVVKNPGSGKALNLDWQNIVPGGNVKGYRIFRRETADQ